MRWCVLGWGCNVSESRKTMIQMAAGEFQGREKLLTKMVFDSRSMLSSYVPQSGEKNTWIRQRILIRPDSLLSNASADAVYLCTDTPSSSLWVGRLYHRFQWHPLAAILLRRPQVVGQQNPPPLLLGANQTQNLTWEGSLNRTTQCFIAR